MWGLNTFKVKSMKVTHTQPNSQAWLDPRVVFYDLRGGGFSGGASIIRHFDWWIQEPRTIHCHSQTKNVTIGLKKTFHFLLKWWKTDLASKCDYRFSTPFFNTRKLSQWCQSSALATPNTGNHRIENKMAKMWKVLWKLQSLKFFWCCICTCDCKPQPQLSLPETLLHETWWSQTLIAGFWGTFQGFG